MPPVETKYFIYIRKSSEGEDRQILSIPAQLEDIQKTVDRFNFTIVDTIIDSKSAFIPDNRPAFTKMLKRIDKGEANGILCWHINRLSRNHLENGAIQWRLQNNKIVAIVTPNRIYRTEDNALLYGIEATEAVQYSRDLSMNVKRGLTQKINMGWPPGMAPQGYLNTKSSIQGSNTILPDPERWPLIRKGFDMLLSGAYTVHQIVDTLNNKLGFRTRPGKERGGKPIAESSMYRIFCDPFYYGYFLRKGQLYKGAYNPMITYDEFDRVQEILGRKNRPRPKNHVYPFTGFIKCGYCGASITASKKVKQIKSTGEMKTYCFYHCTKRKKNISCIGSCYFHEDEIAEMILIEMLKYEIRPKFKDWGLTIMKENYQDEIDNRLKLLSNQEHAEHQTQRELDQLIEMRISSEISPEIYREKKALKESKLIQITEEKLRIEKTAKNWILEFEKNFDFLINIIKDFCSDDINIKKEVCHKFGWNWVLKDKKLLIDKQEYVEPIRKYKMGIEDVFGRFEPEKTFAAKGEKASFELLRPLVCTLIKDVRNSSHN